MFFLMGINTDRIEHNHDQTMICDVCERYGHLNVFMTCSVLSLFFLPVFRWNRHYYVEMSCCQSLYELDEQIGRMIEKGEDVEIRKEDLTLLNKTKGYKKCQYCGYETDEDFDFCPKCGQRF